MFSWHMKGECFDVMDMLVNELEKHFSNFDIYVVGIMYSQFMIPLSPCIFGVIKKHYCEMKSVKPSFLQII
jgi:hypothetical protein